MSTNNTKIIESVFVINDAVNTILDITDKYISDMDPNKSQSLIMKDITYSTSQVSVLLTLLLAQITSWKNLTTPLLSVSGFEQNVLLELALHINVVNDFYKKKGLLDGDYKSPIEKAFFLLIKTNRSGANRFPIE